jgi:D-glycero-D-manno-heptose 1,7-bisphosphate phosphatase
MLFQAQREFALDLSRTPFFGDDPRDGAAAEAAGCPFTFISAEYPLAAAVDTLLARQKAA